VRVLAVAELLDALEGEVDGGRERVVVAGGVGLVEPGDDGGVVGSGVGESRPGQPTPGGVAEFALAPELVEHGAVLGGVDEDGHVVVVLGRGPHHGGATDVDHLDAGLLTEGVEVAHDEVDGRDAVGLEVGQVLGLRTVGEYAAVDLGVERLDPAAEHLGRPGDLGHLGVGDAVLGQEPGRVAARHQLDVEGGQALGQSLEAGLVPHREQGPHRPISFKKLTIVCG
jgi:hypothetical protein